MDNDGWVDIQEIVNGTDPLDPTEPWDSDRDGIPDYWEYQNGTDPLDPNDPPPKLLKSTFSFFSEQTTVEEKPVFPALEISSSKKVWHATAWYGKRLDYTFIVPTSGCGWQPLSGTEIEIWGTGFYDLLARGSSSGIAITLNKPSAGDYILRWSHMARPDGCEPTYQVKIENSSPLVSMGYTAPTRTEAEGAVDCELKFKIEETGRDDVRICFIPTGAGTKGPLISGITIKNNICIETVGFLGTTGKQMVTKDDGSGFPAGAEWKARRQTQTPAAFKSGSELKVLPTFSGILSGLEPKKVRAVFDIPTVDGIDVKIIEKDWTQVSEGFSIGAPVALGFVDYWSTLTIEWFVQYRGEATWTSVGESSHEVYFTRATSEPGFQQETLYWVSCSSCRNKSSEVDIIDGIWKNFAGLSIHKKSDSKTILTYWGANAIQNPRSYFTCQELLKYGDGKCGAWAEFFGACVKLQGVTAEHIEIRPKNSNEGLMVDSFTFIGKETIGELYPYYLRDDLSSDSHSLSLPSGAYDEEGIVAQNNSNPKSSFNNHALSKVIVNGNFVFYDPSYGKKYPSISAWEDGESGNSSLNTNFGSIAGYYAKDGRVKDSDGCLRFKCRINLSDLDETQEINSTEQ